MTARLVAGLAVTAEMLSHRGDWIETALCRRNANRNMGWTSHDATTAQVQAMVAMCHQCPSYEPCREEALTDPRPEGVRAGIVFRVYGWSKRKVHTRCKVCNVELVTFGSNVPPKSCSSECRNELLRRHLLISNPRRREAS